VIRVLTAVHPDEAAGIEGVLAEACAAISLQVDVRSDHPPDQADYVVYAPTSGLKDFTPFMRARAVLGYWAGVEKIVGNQSLTQPLCRMIEPGLTEGMIDWVAGHVMRHHLDTDRDVLGQTGAWDYRVPPLARDRTVGILGLGELGRAVADALAGLNFRVLGWSRRAKDLPGIETFAGEAGLAQVLSEAEILVLLLPLTPATDNLMNGDTFGAMPEGAVLLNPGRGELVDDAALLAALDAGQLSHATLDVFRTEPLPSDHPFWADARVTITPHLASATRIKTACAALAENIRRGEAGEPFLGLVDRGAGY
jgi:glyoxylate/hydroxypyruvate reductase A